MYGPERNDRKASDTTHCGESEYMHCQETCLCAHVEVCSQVIRLELATIWRFKKKNTFLVVKKYFKYSMLEF